jgi:hypothetical protein
MRSLIKFVIVTVEVVAFGLLASAVVRGEEFTTRPVRVSMTNKDGQVTTLEYRTPVKIVAQSSDSPPPLVAIDSRPARDADLLPALHRQVDSYNDTYAAPSTSLPEITSLREVRYPGQPTPSVQQASYQTQTVNYSPSTPTYSTTPIGQVGNAVPMSGMPTYNYAAPQTVVNYPPTTTYSPVNYQVPVTGVPRTVYSPIMQTPIMPVAQSNVQVGTGIYGQPVIYRPGQPLRNAWRWLTP